MAIFKNFESFINWYDRVAKYPTSKIDIEALKEEIEEGVWAKGAGGYELSGFDSKSGNPETYDFECEYIMDEETGDVLEEIYTF